VPPSSPALSCVLASLLLASSSPAALLTVTTASDSGSGSLRAAMDAANTTTALDIIQFNIAPAGPKKILLGSPLPLQQFPIIIDGTTQPGFSAATSVPIIEITATVLTQTEPAVIEIDGGGSIIRGLVVNGFYGIVGFSGSGNQIRGCYIGTNATGTASAAQGIGIVIADSVNNTIGGPTAPDRNVISGCANANGSSLGVLIDGAPTAFIIGNYIGTDPSGTLAVPNDDGVLVANSTGNTTIRSNLISGNDGAGIAVIGADSRGTIIQGNLIGVSADESTPVPNLIGIDLFAETPVVRIGGTAPGEGNVVAGNFTAGVYVRGASAALLLGNGIGTDRTGLKELGNGSSGILIGDENNGSQGSATVGDGSTAGRNFIAFNGLSGVEVWSGYAAIRANSISQNGTLGIDIAATGENSFFVNPNDLLDADIGPNDVQNFPTLTTAVPSGANTLISGTISSSPNSTLTIDLYSNTAIDPSGHGEGATWVGSTNVITNASGTGSWQITAAGGKGRAFTATATRPGSPGATSEFSASFDYSNALVAFAEASANVLESAGTHLATLTRTGPPGTAFSVRVRAFDDTASQPAHYSFPTQTVNFTATQTSAVISVSLVDDTIQNPVRSFTLFVDNPTNGVVVGPLPSQIVNVADDNDTPPTISFGPRVPAAGEGNTGTTTVTFEVLLDRTYSSVVTVLFSTLAGSADAGSDFTPASATLTFPPGTISRTATVQVLGDNTYETDEFFSVQLSNPSGASLIGSPSLINHTITNDDSPPTVTISSVTVAENVAGGQAMVTLNVSNPTSLTISGILVLTAGTASVTEDYLGFQTSFNIPPNSTSFQVPVIIIDDSMDEADETFTLAITGLINGTPGASVTATIIDNDNPPQLIIADRIFTEPDTGTVLGRVEVRLSTASGKTVSAPVTAVSGTATAGSDFGIISLPAIFNPGETSKIIILPILPDGLSEAEESLTLSTPSSPDFLSPVVPPVVRIVALQVINYQKTGNLHTLQFMAGYGQTYRLWKSSTLAGWTQLGTPKTGIGQMETLSTTQPAETAFFFRIRLEPRPFQP
jgi:Calx-beta domain/Right handed beta helix region